MNFPKTDDNDRTHKNDSNTLTYGQWARIFQKKSKQGGGVL